jgi:putative transposase
MARKRPRVEPTDDFQEILPLCWWPEQVEYERIRQPVLFGTSITKRAEQTGVSRRTLQRRIARFGEEGMEGLFETEAAKRQKLPPNIRRFIVDLKAEYPPFNLNEIANVVGACFGRKPDVRSVERVLDGAARPLRLERNYPRYHEMGSGEGRGAVVKLRVDGWSAKAIAGYLGIGRSTVYKILKRFEEEGAEGLADKPHGRPSGVRKVTLAAIEEVRKLAQNPQIGAFRAHAALKQKGFDLSRATCGRILVRVREIYGYDKPKSGGGAKKSMPFASSRHHEFWTADVRYLDMLDEELLADGMVYAITILENYSRALLASALTRRQDLITPSSPSSTGRYSTTARPRHSSPTPAPSSSPTGRRPSTGLWASASWRSRRDNPGRATFKPPGASSVGWRTTTSQEPRTGPGCSKSTIGG